MDGGSHRSAYLPERGGPDSASSSKLLSESPSTERSTLCNSGSIISVDEVIACPSSLQPVRINVEDKRHRKRQHVSVAAVHDVRYGCFSSLYFSLMSCWADWTHDVDQGISNRFFFQDTRPVRNASSPPNISSTCLASSGCLCCHIADMRRHVNMMRGRYRFQCGWSLPYD